jgi:hypothetical protein
MLNHELRHDEGVLVLTPEDPLEAADFTVLTSQVDTYLEQHTMLHGVLIRAKSFPGWKDFSAMLAHVKFLKNHISRIEKVAVVADGALASTIPGLADLFVHAEIQHFDFDNEDAAWVWLRRTDMRLRPAA